MKKLFSLFLAIMILLSAIGCASYKTKLKRNGVRVVSATERIEDGPDGILLEAVLEGMAEYYSANLAENVKRGLHGNARKC